MNPPPTDGLSPLPLPPHRVPKEVRQVRTRSKSLNELVLSAPIDVQPKSSSNSKRPLLIQLKSNLGVLQNILKMLRNINYSNPPAYLQSVMQSYEKPIDTIVGVVQRLQSGKSESQLMERKLYAFSKVYPKFKQFGEGFKRGVTHAQTWVEILALFCRVVDELMETTVSLL